MATMGQLPLSHSRANADSLEKPSSTGQNPPGSAPHPAEPAQCKPVYPEFRSRRLAELGRDSALR